MKIPVKFPSRFYGLALPFLLVFPGLPGLFGMTSLTIAQANGCKMIPGQFDDCMLNGGPWGYVTRLLWGFGNVTMPIMPFVSWAFVGVLTTFVLHWTVWWWQHGRSQ